MKKIFVCALALLSATAIYGEEKHIVVVIPSYNNARWCERNLLSVFAQKYSNYHVIYTDDCSSDNTYELVTALVKKYHQEHRVTAIRNQDRCKALKNLVRMIYSCNNHDLILTMDGDDWFPNENVFSYINNVYADPTVWITYGQYAEIHPDGTYTRGFNGPMPDSVIKNNLFRDQFFSHLRTFYAGLFKKIRIEDLMYEGEFFAMSWDLAIMIPMMEMARYHFKYIPDILYIYNALNEINDHKVSRELQKTHERIIRSRTPYTAIQILF
jgi:glycosyltransferase involved in cell wall biosynthesis